MKKVLSIKGGSSLKYESSITLKMDKWHPNNFYRKLKIKKIYGER
jgi:hypothetical protein